MYIPLESVRLRGDRLLTEHVQVGSGGSGITLPGQASEDKHQYLVRVLKTGPGVDKDVRDHVEGQSDPLVVLGSAFKRVFYLDAPDSTQTREYLLADSSAVLALIPALPDGTTITRAEE